MSSSTLESSLYQQQHHHDEQQQGAVENRLPLTTSSHRAAARLEIQNAWRERRQQQQQQKSASDGIKKHNYSVMQTPSLRSKQRGRDQQTKQSNQKTGTSTVNVNHSNTTIPVFPSICSIVSRAFKQQHQQTKRTRNCQPQQQASIKKDDKHKEVSTSIGKDNPSSTETRVRTTHQAGKNSSKYTTETFPSVLNILQANALVQHVEQTLSQQQQACDHDHANDDDERRYDRHTNTRPDHDKNRHHHTSENRWNVFASEYDFQHGLIEMARGRSRAFYLVDIATVVRRLVEMEETYPEIRCWTHPIGSVIPAMQNLLRKHGLYFVVDDTSAQDLQRLDEHDNENNGDNRRSNSKSAISPESENGMDTVHVDDKRSDSTIVFDSTLRAGKPDGYIRRFLSSNKTDRVLVIDGPDEILRLSRTIQRLQQRQQRRNATESGTTTMIRCHGFILRLPTENHDGEGKKYESSWDTLLQRTRSAIMLLHESEVKSGSFSTVASETSRTRCSVQYRLKGISVDVHNNFDDDEHRKRTRQAALSRLVDQVLTWYEQHPQMMQFSPRDNTHTENPSFRIDLTGFTEFPIDCTWVEWWRSLLRKHHNQRQQKFCQIEISIDSSNILLPQAGALCTRIIGVRETSQSTKGRIVKEGDSSNPSSTDTLPDSTGRVAKSDDPESLLPVQKHCHRHYYIDDGCYGSLYQQPGSTTNGTNAFQPLPLLTSRQQKETSLTNDRPTDQLESKDEKESLLLSTVWGPTCDGLDRVCRDILLPELHRDDWLVFFPTKYISSEKNNDSDNKGKGGCYSNKLVRSSCRLDDKNQNTAFNGFEPPDIACCVVGYFPK